MNEEINTTPTCTHNEFITAGSLSAQHKKWREVESASLALSENIKFFQCHICRRLLYVHGQKEDTSGTNLFIVCDALHWVTPSSLCEKRCGMLHHLQLFRNAALRSQRHFIRGQSSGFDEKSVCGRRCWDWELCACYEDDSSVEEGERDTVTVAPSLDRGSFNLRWTQKTTDSDKSLSLSLI